MAVPTGSTKERSYNGDYMQAGRKAEEKVMAFIRGQPWVVGIDDWRELRAVHEADVDCAIKTVDGRVTLAEIKSDAYLGVSGNMLFEILRINHTCIPERACTLGWSARSPATYFLYYAPASDQIYQVRVDDLRRAFQRYTSETRQESRIIWVNTDRIKSTVNVLIPKRYWDGIVTIHNLAPDANGIPF